ncbi:hypothetical protein GOBAR_DD33785 [Gossypium barbadense]|nr:hypothetical protein GOBAR_DD33785 [Gossypium barbadense]
MGICSSCESTQITTANLILQDGRLQEFPYPVKVSYVLQRNPMCFICNSDEMDFDDVVSAIEEDEELQPAEEMAALAVKASSALMKSGGCGGEKSGSRRKTVIPFEFSCESPRRKVVSGVERGP